MDSKSLDEKGIRVFPERKALSKSKVRDKLLSMLKTLDELPDEAMPLMCFYGFVFPNGSLAIGDTYEDPADGDEQQEVNITMLAFALERLAEQYKTFATYGQENPMRENDWVEF